MSRTKVSKPFKPVNLWMVSVMLLIGLANILWAERLTFNGGLGWDGTLYGGWVKDFYGSIFIQGVPQYYAQRILPSAIVHYGMRLFRVPLETKNIIHAFDVYNLLLILLSVYFWGLISDELKLRNQGKWFGFCCLFLNYAILKNNFYHSVLTDTSAFALGILMFYFFLKDKPLGLLAVILLGGFTWPTESYMAALLYVFPYQKGSEQPTKAIAPPNSWMPNIFAGFVCVVALLSYTYLLQPQRFAKWVGEFTGILRIDLRLLYVSVAVVVIYLFLGIRYSAADKRLFDLKSIWRALKWRRAIIAASVLVFLKLAVLRLSNGQAMMWDFKAFVVHTFLVALTEPAIFLVAHTIYYGPIILLLLFFWRPFCDSLRGFGPGFGIFIILNVILSINPQSRYQINVVTAFMIVLVRLLDHSGLSYRSLPVWTLVCVFYSKVWYLFNTGPQVGSPFDFPLQHYFMGSGPWMNHEMYLVQGGVVLLTAILLYFLLTKDLLGIGLNLELWRRVPDETTALAGIE